MTNDDSTTKKESCGGNVTSSAGYHPGFDGPSSFIRRHSSFLIMAATAFGLLLRAWHYGRNPSMWHDEAATCLNILNKSFAGLFGHLDHSATGPPLLLCLQKCVVFILGDGTRSLRLVSFLASCAALVLLVKLARALLDPPAAFCAVLLAACSDHLLWHASEARHYSRDFLIAVVLLLVFVATGRRSITWRLALFAGCAPFAVLFSYPGVFLCAGVMLALLPEVRKDGRAAAWAGLALLGLVVAASFAFFYFVTIRAQRSPDMDAAWIKEFPDLSKPWKLPLWAITSTMGIFDYYVRPYGGGILVLPAIAGAAVFWSRHKRGLLILIVAPMVFAMLASLIKSYPYNGARTMVYCLPGLTLLIAAGLKPLIEWLQLRLPIVPARMLVLVLLFPIAAALVFSIYKAVVPWKRADTAGASAYVLANRLPGDVVTTNHWEYEYYFRNLGPSFTPDIAAATRSPGRGTHRLWLVLNSGAIEDRRHIEESVISSGWHLDHSQEFQNASVFLLSGGARN